MNQDRVLDIFVSASLAAGAKILEIYASDIEVNTKMDQSPVTAADLAADEVILARLRAELPKIAIVSEETGVAAGEVPDAIGTFILVDPLDGTKEFISKNGEFTVNIALVHDGIPVAGVVYAPAIDKIWWGGSTSGAFSAEVKNGSLGEKSAIAVRSAVTGQVTAIGSRSHGAGFDDPRLKAIGVSEFKSAGSSLKFCRVAEGDADIYPRFGRTMEWDTAAGHAVLCAAGGRVETAEGAAFCYGKIKQADDSDYANSHFIAFGDPGLKFPKAVSTVDA